MGRDPRDSAPAGSTTGAGPERARFALADTVCSVEGDAELASAVLDTLGPCPIADGRPEITIRLDRRGPKPPAEVADEEVGTVRLWRRGGTLHGSWAGELTMRADAHEVVLGAGTTAPVSPSRAVRQLLPYAVGHVLGARGLVVVHAGAIALDGTAVVVLGPTGSGKSTLVVAARAAGRTVLADDLVVLALRADALDVWGIPRPVAVATDDPALLPSGAQRLDDDLRGRWQFPLENGGGCRRVAAVLVVEHGDEPDGHLMPLAPTAVWDAVTASLLAGPDPARLRTAFPVLGELARRPGWRLGHGVDPSTRMTVAARLFEQAAAAVE